MRGNCSICGKHRKKSLRPATLWPNILIIECRACHLKCAIPGSCPCSWCKQEEVRSPEWKRIANETRLVWPPPG